MNFLETMSMVCAVILPLWNIPLIARIIKRKSSADISMAWAIGIWVCIILMAPSGFQSTDPVWRTFNIVNLVMFSIVVFFVLKYRKGTDRGMNE